MTRRSSHVVICGWNSHGRRLVDDLQAAAPTIPVVVISQRSETHCPPPEAGKITLIKDDSASRNALGKADAANARAVVILATPLHSPTPHNTDARTILTALSVRSLSEDVHLIAEIRDQANMGLSHTTNIDEIVLVGRFSGVMLSQALQSAGLGGLFTDLFESGRGSALREIPVPGDLVGRRFSQALPEIIILGLGVPAGLRRHADLHLPPKEDLRLRADDLLVVLRTISSKT